MCTLYGAVWGKCVHINKAYVGVCVCVCVWLHVCLLTCLCDKNRRHYIYLRVCVCVCVCVWMYRGIVWVSDINAQLSRWVNPQRTCFKRWQLRTKQNALARLPSLNKCKSIFHVLFLLFYRRWIKRRWREKHEAKVHVCTFLNLEIWAIFFFLFLYMCCL